MLAMLAMRLVLNGSEIIGWFGLAIGAAFIAGLAVGLYAIRRR